MTTGEIWTVAQIGGALITLGILYGAIRQQIQQLIDVIRELKGAVGDLRETLMDHGERISFLEGRQRAVNGAGHSEPERR